TERDSVLIQPFDWSDFSMSHPSCFSTDSVTLHAFSGDAANVCETGSPAIAGVASNNSNAMAPSIRVIEAPPHETPRARRVGCVSRLTDPRLRCFEATPPRNRYKALAPTAASGR